MENKMLKSKLIIDKDEKIQVTVYLGVDKKQNLLGSYDKKKLLDMSELETSEAELLEVNFTFRRPSYRDDINIISESVSQKLDSTGESYSINPATIKYSRFIQLFEDWDLTDDEGKKVEPTPDSIDKLHPVLANSALEGLEENLS